jgi:hypothetical protein
MLQQGSVDCNMCSNKSCALLFEGAVTDHFLFGYPVEDKDNVDDLNPTQCKVKKEKADFLHEVSVILTATATCSHC